MNIVTSPMQPEVVAAPSVLTNPTAFNTEGMLLRSYLRMVKRWRFVILGAAAACVILGLIVTLLMTPQYTAKVTIEILRESGNVTEFKGVEREATSADQEFYQTQYGLLRSRVLSERVANQLRLVDDPAFFEKAGVSSDKPAFTAVNGRLPASGRPTRLRVAGEILLSNLEIDPKRMSRLVDISFTDPDPAFAAKVANAWADNYIKTNLERKVQATSYGRDLLQRQLAEFKEKLDESQRQLVGYASDQEIINLPSQVEGANGSTGERSIVADELAAMNVALAEATTDRIRIGARVSQSGGAASAEALNNPAINTLRQRRAELSAEYQRLLAQFTPEYPAAKAIQQELAQLDRSIRQEEARVSGSVAAEYRQAIKRERDLQARVEQLKGSFLDLRRRSIQYEIFRQEVDTNRALYDGILQRYKEIGVAGGVGVNNISIVDVAEVPRSPSSPQLLVNILLSLILGLVLGTAAAFALEQLDEAIADPAEVERRLGLPLLGSVPAVVDRSPKEELLDRKSELFDAYLAVQTNLAFTTDHGVPRSFAVTSTRPAEGKSTTALALATTLSRAGKKVILVDGDMRSPSVHHFGNTGHDQGLSNFLTGEDDLGPLIFRIEDFSIDAMSSGPLPPNAAELLIGTRFATLLERLLARYDHVVVDSPPVMGLADAPLIASRTEGVIFAVESHGIRSSLVRTALGRLAGANARVFGGVLTKFEVRKGNYGYEYGYGYGREDGPEKERVA